MPSPALSVCSTTRWPLRCLIPALPWCLSNLVFVNVCVKWWMNGDILCKIDNDFVCMNQSTNAAASSSSVSSTATEAVRASNCNKKPHKNNIFILSTYCFLMKAAFRTATSSSTSSSSAATRSLIIDNDDDDPATQRSRRRRKIEYCKLKPWGLLASSQQPSSPSRRIQSVKCQGLSWRIHV